MDNSLQKTSARLTGDPPSSDTNLAAKTGTSMKKNKKSSAGANSAAPNQSGICEIPSKLHQEEIVEVAVNVRKIEIPQNQSREVVEKLRKINFIANRIIKMKELDKNLGKQK